MMENSYLLYLLIVNLDVSSHEKLPQRLLKEQLEVRGRSGRKLDGFREHNFFFSSNNPVKKSAVPLCIWNFALYKKTTERSKT